MGKGDKKTTRGKRIAGSYGKSRPRKQSKPLAEVPVEEVPKVKEAKPKAAKPKAEKKKKTED